MEKMNFKKISSNKHYEVSDTGVVRSLDRELLITRCGKQHTQKCKGKRLKQAINNGYARVALKNNGELKNCLVHRLVAQAFIPNPKNKPQVNHKDGNKLNNHVSNLEWVTPKENLQHAVSNGLNIPLHKRGYAGLRREERVKPRKDSICNLDADFLSDLIECYHNTDISQYEICNLIGYSRSAFQRLLTGNLNYYFLL